MVKFKPDAIVVKSSHEGDGHKGDNEDGDGAVLVSLEEGAGAVLPEGDGVLAGVVDQVLTVGW